MSDCTEELKDVDERASHERALRLLRDSLNDANAVLVKSLSLVVTRSSSAAPHGQDETMSTLMEKMLERYSEQLSTRVCELFQRKLDEQDSQSGNTATKL